MNLLRRQARQLSARVRDRMATVPMLFVFLALVLSQITLGIDRNLGDDALPRILKTTVDSADSILSTIAGGLISAVTLLLSLVLLSVQLASSQFSPRTVRDWIGDKTQQRTIGIVLGTTVFCLMVLRETQTVGDSFTLAPHVSVLVAVALAVLSLIGVVRSVDHLSNSMRIGSVARGLAHETLEAMASSADALPVSASLSAPATPIRAPATDLSRVPITCDTSGWLQRIDMHRLAGAVANNVHVSVVVAPGSFVFAEQPLAWISHSVDVDHDLTADVFEIGDSRLVDHDAMYGLLQLSDIALRALSPGINDPNTAADVVVHMGMVLLKAWEFPQQSDWVEVDGRTIEFLVVTHADYLSEAFSQIVRYASNEHDVLATIIRTVSTIASESSRRSLPGPIEPLEQMMAAVWDTIDRSAELSSSDKNALQALIAKSPVSPFASGNLAS